jgi:hypothetical protein
MPAKSKSTPDKVPIEELRKQTKKALELAAELRSLFQELTELTEEDRKFSQGRMRTGEADILRSVLDAVDLQPEYFKSLADEDEGHDPGRFETDLLRDRLERRALYLQVADALDPIVTGLNDTALHFGGLTRPAVLAAYRIAKTLARTDRKMKTAIAKAIDFYRAPVKARSNKTS